ncbi:MAG: heat-inducible transcriptional repressor HrcA [Armatimonadota bacterium]|nr:heat-inducible transcriptional repressor HrcA [Armatimonadota bacterium]
MGELTQRQKNIATAVVEEHITTAQPVGSEALRRSHDFACSSATIRNEMVRLEERGYLDQPHTSAGRIPLGPAYRLHVDTLPAESGRLDRDVAWVQGELRRVAGRHETALRLSSAILSRITRYPAVVIAPRERGPRLIDLSLTPVSARNVLLSYLDDAGASEEVLIETHQPVTVEEVAELEALLHQRVLGRPLGSELPLEGVEIDAGLLAGLRQALEDASRGRVYVEGTTFILDEPEFAELDRLRRVISILMQSPILRRALDAGMAEEGPTVRIGPEHGIEPLRDCSVVAASYSVDDRRTGVLGVLGPMRMRYEVALQMVELIARNLGHALSRAEEN